MGAVLCVCVFGGGGVPGLLRSPLGGCRGVDRVVPRSATFSVPQAVLAHPQAHPSLSLPHRVQTPTQRCQAAGFLNNLRWHISYRGPSLACLPRGDPLALAHSPDSDTTTVHLLCARQEQSAVFKATLTDVPLGKRGLSGCLPRSGTLGRVQKRGRESGSRGEAWWAWGAGEDWIQSWARRKVWGQSGPGL